MPYYCAKLLSVCLVQDGKPRKRNTCDRSLVLLQASDFSAAANLALNTGKERETRYKNARGQSVRWVFMGVEELRELPASLANVEVGSVLGVLSSPAPVAFAARFNPKKMEPVLS